jgi:hypothetical protein
MQAPFLSAGGRDELLSIKLHENIYVGQEFGEEILMELSQNLSLSQKQQLKLSPQMPSPSS